MSLVSVASARSTPDPSLGVTSVSPSSVERDAHVSERVKGRSSSQSSGGRSPDAPANWTVQCTFRPAAPMNREEGSLAIAKRQQELEEKQKQELIGEIYKRCKQYETVIRNQELEERCLPSDLREALQGVSAHEQALYKQEFANELNKRAKAIW